MVKCDVCHGFNPLFIRSVFLLKTPSGSHLLQPSHVSIPYSSGQCFFYDNYTDEIQGSQFQSLIHQVSVSFGSFSISLFLFSESFNPLFIRSVFLLKKSDKVCCLRFKVSIPYSSGQCFFSPLSTPFPIQGVSFNPLFIRSVFLLRKPSGNRRIRWSCFNPLFIRSVFLF